MVRGEGGSSRRRGRFFLNVFHSMCTVFSSLSSIFPASSGGRRQPRSDSRRRTGDSTTPKNGNGAAPADAPVELKEQHGNSAASTFPEKKVAENSPDASSKDASKENSAAPPSKSGEPPPKDGPTKKEDSPRRQDAADGPRGRGPPDEREGSSRISQNRAGDPTRIRERDRDRDRKKRHDDRDRGPHHDRHRDRRGDRGDRDRKRHRGDSRDRRKQRNGSPQSSSAGEKADEQPKPKSNFSAPKESKFSGGGFSGVGGFTQSLGQPQAKFGVGGRPGAGAGVGAMMPVASPNDSASSGESANKPTMDIHAVLAGIGKLKATKAELQLGRMGRVCIGGGWWIVFVMLPYPLFGEGDPRRDVTVTGSVMAGTTSN